MGAGGGPVGGVHRPGGGDDAALVRRWVDHGDRRAVEELLSRHEPALRVLCRRLCGPGTDADDALQDALVAVVRGLPGFDGRAAFSTWAYRVATNACLDELRRRRRRPVPVERLPGPEPAAPAVGERPGDADRDALLAALAALPAEFRAPVVLRDVLDLDYAEIAEVLGLPPGTVRSRIARGRARLADLLPAEPVVTRPGNQDGTADVQPDGGP